MPKQASINLIVYYPKSDSGREELATRVAQVHADTVLMHIKQLGCPNIQKTQLLDAIIADARERAAVGTSSHKLRHPRER